MIVFYRIIFCTALSAFAVSHVWAADEDRVKKDLFTVITLQGKPCGEVTAVKQLGENDYLATCKSGDRYRVYVGAGDRVIVEKQ